MTSPPPSAARTAALTAPTMLAFAGNSLLCRGALAPRLVDPASFTAIRLAAGALALWALALLGRRGRPRGGSWTSAFVLFAYAIAFSFAYVRIPAGVGALLLFGAVQATMLLWALGRGERPTPPQWLGIAVALGGLAALTLPGAKAPEPLGAASMVAAGAFWGAYTLRGRGARDPLAANADNFARSLPLVAALGLASAHSLRASAAGAALAATAGAVTTGLGYTLWYAALPGLGATRAAAVQLSVPVLAALGAAVLLGEPVTLRFAASGTAILAGVALATLRS